MRKPKRLPRVTVDDDQRAEALADAVSEAVAGLPAAARGYAMALLLAAPGAAMLPGVRDEAYRGLRYLPRPPIDAAAVESLLAVVNGDRRARVTDPAAECALGWFIALARETLPFGRNVLVPETVTTIWFSLRDELTRDS